LVKLRQSYMVEDVIRLKEPWPDEVCDENQIKPDGGE
jgi:hypothetical protein